MRIHRVSMHFHWRLWLSAGSLRNYQGDYPKKAIVCCFLEEDKLIYDSLL